MLLEKLLPLTSERFPKPRKLNLGPLDSLSHKKKQKPKRIKWTLEEHEQVMTAFYQGLNEPKNKNRKRTYEIWRKEVGEHRSYIHANKQKKTRLTKKTNRS